jgi:RimJ/RimL family protein N-acetyltransferase
MNYLKIAWNIVNYGIHRPVCTHEYFLELKGYAKMALQNLLQWLKDQGQVSTPITCEPSNEASKKVILSCGGKLTDTCTYKGIDLMVFEIPIE